MARTLIEDRRLVDVAQRPIQTTNIPCSVRRGSRSRPGTWRRRMCNMDTQRHYSSLSPIRSSHTYFWNGEQTMACYETPKKRIL